MKEREGEGDWWDLTQSVSRAAAMFGKVKREV